VSDALNRFEEALEEQAGPHLDIPRGITFREFMHQHAKVLVPDEKTGAKRVVQYTTAGREPLDVILTLIDYILGHDMSWVPPEVRECLWGDANDTGGRLITDAEVHPSGGAQFGKTVLGLHLKAYLPAVKGFASYYVLPDNDLVEAIVDGKERPEVLDQVAWLNDMVSIGKVVNESGKTVNRKGGMMFADGEHPATMSYMRGMNKIPTSISADAVIQDETDDVPPDNSKFLKGRMTASGLRFFMAIGTMRYHGAGQNKVFESGTQHVGLLPCWGCGHDSNPEDNWPAICRIAMDGKPSIDDPQLTYEGDFKYGGKGETVATFDHDAHYYFACPHCGTELVREAIYYKPRRPDRIKERRWSVRVSQMCCSALPLKMIVADWCQNAVRDPDAMIAFNCDRLAKPKSTMQKLTPAVLARARGLEDFPLSLTPSENAVALYGGMDTGDRCWLVAREVESKAVRRIRWAEQFSPERARERVPLLFNTLGLSCLFIDIGAERSLARDLCNIINGVVGWEPPALDNPEKAYIQFNRNLAWNGEAGKWKGIKCACVEFSLKPGQGIRHKLGIPQDGPYYPIVQANRDETLQRVVNELLTAEEGVVEVIDGKMRTAPSMRLPAKGPGAQAIVETFDNHLLAGSRKEKDSKGLEHFIAKVENHLLLADAYSGLCELVGGDACHMRPFEFERVHDNHPYAESRGVLL